MAPILPIIVSWLFFKMSQMIFPAERVQNGVLVLAKLLHPTRSLGPLQKEASNPESRQSQSSKGANKQRKRLSIVITLRTKGGSAWEKENSTPCGWFQNRTSRPAPGHARPTTHRFRCFEQAKSGKVYVKTRQNWHLAACLVNMCLRWESCTCKMRRLRQRSDVLSSQNMTKSKWRLGKVRCTSICLQHPEQPSAHNKSLSLCTVFFRVAISIFNQCACLTCFGRIWPESWRSFIRIGKTSFSNLMLATF